MPGSLGLRQEIRLLGPWEFRGNHGDIVVLTRRLRLLMTALALSANKPVSVDMLAEQLWPEQLPVRARGLVHTYIGRLRKQLGAAMIGTQPGGGYRLSLSAEAVDVFRFRDLLVKAR